MSPADPEPVRSVRAAAELLGVVPAASAETTQKGAFGHGRPSGEILNPERARKVPASPVHDLRDRASGSVGQRRADELGLPAGAMRCHHQTSRDRVGDPPAEIAGDEIQAGVDPRRASRGGQDVSVVDIKDVGVHGDLRVSRRELHRVTPMRRRPPPVEEPRRGQDEDTGTDRDEPGAAAMRLPQGGKERFGGRLSPIPPAGDHDRPRPGKLGEARLRDDRNPARRAQRPAIRADDGEAIPGECELGTGEPEILRQDPELERTDRRRRRQRRGPGSGMADFTTC